MSDCRCRNQKAKAINGLSRDMAAVEQTDLLNGLRGHESTGANRYFKTLGQLMVNEAFAFTAHNLGSRILIIGKPAYSAAGVLHRLKCSLQHTLDIVSCATIDPLNTKL